MFRLRSHLPALAFALVVASASGCGHGSDSVSSTGMSGGSGTAGALAADALTATMQVRDSLVNGPCLGFGLPIGIPSGCPYDAASGTFTCGTEPGHDGMSVTRSYQFRDATGTPQAAYDSLATASIRFTSHVAGTMVRDGRWSQVDDWRELVESGLEGLETARTWNGTATASHLDSLTGPDGSRRARTSTAATTVADVVVPAPFGRESWPLSGSISTHLVNSDGLDLTAVLSFNGTRYATLTVNGAALTVDLARPGLGGPGGPMGGPMGGPGGGMGGPGGPMGGPGGGMH